MERTTARRHPSARMRPVAGLLPASASGRTRGRGQVRVGSSAVGGARIAMMSLLRRSPRAVYRVYSEDDFLAGVEPLTDADVDVDADVAGGEMALAGEDMALAGREMALADGEMAFVGAEMGAAGGEMTFVQEGFGREEALMAQEAPATQEIPVAQETPATPEMSTTAQEASPARKPALAPGLRARRLTVGVALAGVVGVVGAAIGIAVLPGRQVQSGRQLAHQGHDGVPFSPGPVSERAPKTSIPAVRSALVAGRRSTHFGTGPLPRVASPSRVSRSGRLPRSSRVAFPRSSRVARSLPAARFVSSYRRAVVTTPAPAALSPTPSLSSSPPPATGSEPDPQSASESSAVSSAYVHVQVPPPQLDAQIEFGFER